ncbi:hypothetical protein CLV40_101397 [Actinokineospora auranticolor]|uniref:Uncharacterized protein n=1 Tax=Actinokineospora auranticolor TaxID=155976 RepID=A0A2S6H148_9PSEU|nr:hypothetical protein CLV40_101397 [Actinokineospora auranticolor]
MVEPAEQGVEQYRFQFLLTLSRRAREDALPQVVRHGDVVATEGVYQDLAVGGGEVPT